MYEFNYLGSRIVYHLFINCYVASFVGAIEFHRNMTLLYLLETTIHAAAFNDWMGNWLPVY